MHDYTDLFEGQKYSPVDFAKMGFCLKLTLKDTARNGPLRALHSRY